MVSIFIVVVKQSSVKKIEDMHHPAIVCVGGGGNCLEISCTFQESIAEIKSTSEPLRTCGVVVLSLCQLPGGFCGDWCYWRCNGSDGR